jgi:cytochrome c nitrite reductase small subunit
MIEKFLPPAKWRLPVMFVSAIFIGIVLFTLYMSKAHSYLSDDPEACVNCHIMAPQYATWAHSSHREWANCNDCHIPQDNIFNKYYFKASDGLRHSTLFALRKERQVIMILEAGAKVVQNNCIRCHEKQIIDPKLEASVAMHRATREDRRCVDCHREEGGHGSVNSLSSVPYARVPLPQSPVPEWLRKYINN